MKKNLRKLRKDAEISQDGLAKQMGVDRSTIAKWETGEASPRADKLPQIAEILGCTIDDLFEGKDRAE